jgi:hypothetical protein
MRHAQICCPSGSALSTVIYEIQMPVKIQEYHIVVMATIFSGVVTYQVRQI